MGPWSRAISSSVNPSDWSHLRRVAWVFLEPIAPMYVAGDRSATLSAGSSNFGSCERMQT